jgi:hypothetical protein
MLLQQPLNVKDNLNIDGNLTAFFLTLAHNPSFCHQEISSVWDLMMKI